MPRVRSLSLSRVVNPISALSRWKILDNLRRSLIPISMLAVLMLAWQSGSNSLALTATIFVVSVVMLPTLFALLKDIAIKPTDLPVGTHLATAFASAGRPLAQCLFTLTFLPYEACINLDAVARTLIRVHWTRSRLLEWKTSSDSDRSVRSDLPGFFRAMFVAPTLALAALLFFVASRRDVLGIAAPLLLLWLASPAIAWWLSRPIPAREVKLSNGQHHFLRRSARKTWRSISR